MIIDWFTVIAQALNFLVLVWLLKRFLYKPILNAIDEREKRIAHALAEAKARNAEALQEKNDFNDKNKQLEQQRAALLAKATEDANAEGQRLRSEAQLAASAYTVKRQEALRREQQSLNDEITQRTLKEVFAITRKTLMDLAGVSLEERMAEVFIIRLQELEDEKRKAIANVLTTSPSAVLVRSAFLLPPLLQKQIQQALKEIISPDINTSFETSPELISGIELTADGHKIAWSITEYLGSLEKSMTEIMGEQAKPKPVTSPASDEEDI
jgi:F-type H+-transporting ATPase subunit b